MDAHLIEEPQPARYRLHDLLRAFAAAVAGAADQESDRRAAIGRLLDYYLHAAVAASASLDSESSRQVLHRDLTIGAPARPDLLERPGTLGAGWFEIERPTLLAAIRCAVGQGHWQHAWQLARAMWRFLARRSYLADLLDTHRCGLTTAERLGDSNAVATMRNYVAYGYARTGDYDEAITHLLAALEHRQTIGDRIGEVGTRQNLFIAYVHAGRHRAALEECERCLTLARRSRDATTLAMAVINASYVYLTLGRLPEALQHSRNALLLAREVGNSQVIAIAIGNVGAVRARLGHHGPARRLLHAGLRASRRTSDRHVEAEMLNELGMIDRANGEYDRAVARHREALGLTREAGLRQDECTVYYELGRTMHAAGDMAAALELHRRALAGSRQIQFRVGEVRALDGMAECLRVTDPEAARQLWLDTWARYRELELPEASEVERQLAALAGGSDE